MPHFSVHRSQSSPFFTIVIIIIIIVVVVVVTPSSSPFVQLIIAAFNPSTIGQHMWNVCPGIRVLMEMCITRCYYYPPLKTPEAAELERLSEAQQQREQQERSEILALEQRVQAQLTQPEAVYRTLTHYRA